MQSIIAWFVAPGVLLAVSFGLGVLVARLTRLDLPPALLAPVGAGLAIVLALAAYVVFRDAVAAPLALALLGAAGIVLELQARRSLPRPGLGALVLAVTYGLYIAPVVLSGHWTWTGYNFVNDTSIQLLLADWLPGHGRVPPPQPLVSTPLDALRSYLYGGYPLGSHALLAGLHALVPVRLEAIYQPFISTFAGLGAMALSVLVRPLAGARWAVFAAFTALTSNLLYQYALQGNMKEIVTAALLATTAAVAGWTLNELRRSKPAVRPRLLVASAVLLAVPFSAVVDALSTAGAPYAALVVALWIGLLAVHRVLPGARAFATALGAGVVALALGSAATFSELVAFGQATTTTYATAATATDLGHLVQPLDPLQTAGIWLIGDYRFVPTGINAAATTVGAWLVVALAVGATVWALRRRRAGVLLFAVPVVLIMLVVTPRVSPYADAKTYMLMAPAVTLLGALGASAFGRGRLRVVGVILGALVLGGTLWSDALAYHVVHLAPTDRMAALRDLDRRFAGQGPILFNEPEEFAKNFMEDTRVNVGAEAVTPAQTQLRVPQAFAYLWYDLDDLKLDYVERFPLVVVRRSPVNSRPPANFHLIYHNQYYEVWRRSNGPRVIDHLPLQAVHQPALRPRCADVRALVSRARPGDRIVVSPAPDLVQLDTANARRSPGWVTHPYRADMVLTQTPGSAHARVQVPRGGRYRGWIAGSFGRPITGWVDGRPIGSSVGVDNVGQWHDIGTVRLSRGSHTVRLTRPGGDLSPGDGFTGELGPLALERIRTPRLVRLRPSQAAARLCGRSWDWLELVRPGGRAYARP